MISHRFGYGNNLRNALGLMWRIGLVVALFAIPLMSYQL